MIMTIDELCQYVERETAKRKARPVWGRWRLIRRWAVLRHEGSGYEIDLEQCTSSAGVLDWVFQVYGKAWMTPADVRDLMDALYDLVSPQANLCSWRHEQPNGADAVRARLKEWGVRLREAQR